MTIIEKYEKLQADYNTLETRLQEALALSEPLKVEVEELRAAAVVIPEDFTAMKEEVETLKKTNSELETQVTELQVKLAEANVDKAKFEERVSESAVELIASQGVPAINVSPLANPASPDFTGDLMAQYNAIKDCAEQRKFWEAHREEFVKALKGIKD